MNNTAKQPSLINAEEAQKIISFATGRTINWPNDVNSEIRLIGAILAAGEFSQNNANETYQRANRLSARDFWHPPHNAIWGVMQRIAENGNNIEITSVAAELSKHKKGNGTWLDHIGGENYLIELSNKAGTAIETYVDIIEEKALYRSFIFAGETALKMGHHPGDNQFAEVAAQALVLFNDIMVRATHAKGKVTYTYAEAVGNRIQQILSESKDPDFVPGISTQLELPEKLLQGFKPNKLYIPTGITGHGKSAFLIHCALAALRQNKRVVFITLEMPVEELTDRMIISECNIDGERYTNRDFSENDENKIINMHQRLLELQEQRQLYLVPLNTPTMTEIKAEIDALLLLGGFDMIIVDYCGPEMISVEDRYPRGASDPTRAAEHMWTVFRKMKLTYDVPLIVAAQVNDDYKGRANKQPGLNDLAYSRLSSKAADCVIILHIPSEFEEFVNPQDQDKMLIHVAKHRGGRTGKVFVNFHRPTFRFSKWYPPMNSHKPDDEQEIPF